MITKGKRENDNETKTARDEREKERSIKKTEKERSILGVNQRIARYCKIHKYFQQKEIQTERETDREREILYNDRAQTIANYFKILNFEEKEISIQKGREIEREIQTPRKKDRERDLLKILPNYCKLQESSQIFRGERERYND